MGINTAKLRGLAAEQKLPLWKIAQRLGYPPSTFSDYVRGRLTAPPKLAERIERELNVPKGTLDEGA